MQQRYPEVVEASEAADLAACKQLLANGSRSFHMASLLLPRRVSDPAMALYGFCRLADDIIDQELRSDDALQSIHYRLDRAYGGTPLPYPVDRSFARVVAQFAIPRALPEALIEGFRWDVEGRRYESLADLLDYAARVAGTVGAMMALLMGARSPSQIARACELGVAMQLTNIARDVGEDARAGRIYIPLSWMRAAGIDADDWLRRPQFNAAIGEIVGQLLAAAADFYERAEAGIAGLPTDCRPGIFAARLLYADIGRSIARAGFNSVDRRAIVPPGRKLSLLARAGVRSVRFQHVEDGAVLPAVEFLVAATSTGRGGSDAVGSVAADGAAVPWWHLPQRIVRVIEIFERLEQLDRSRALERRNVGVLSASGRVGG
jgi:phytoene synthase